MGFLIDTCIWIDIERGRLDRSEIYAITRQEPVFLSPVNIAEITYGIALLSDPTRKAKAKDALRCMKRKPTIRITNETAEIFGAIAAELNRRGRAHACRVQDLWLSSQAIQRDFSLITANAGDFQDLPGLRCVVLPAP
ncbi:MAG: PIN domain-containing protein [Verrucomicrobiae bacterium]|nr:PIN domain-containing protein [Verrucomicrobiae bacterium]